MAGAVNARVARSPSSAGRGLPASCADPGLRGVSVLRWAGYRNRSITALAVGAGFVRELVEDGPHGGQAGLQPSRAPAGHHQVPAPLARSS